MPSVPAPQASAGAVSGRGARAARRPAAGSRAGTRPRRAGGWRMRSCAPCERAWSTSRSRRPERLGAELRGPLDEDREDAAAQRGHRVALAVDDGQRLADDGRADDAGPRGELAWPRRRSRAGRASAPAGWPDRSRASVGLGEPDAEVLRGGQPGVGVEAVGQRGVGGLVGGPALAQRADERAAAGWRPSQGGEQAREVVDRLADARRRRRPARRRGARPRAGRRCRRRERLDERVDGRVVPVGRTQPDGREAVVCQRSRTSGGRPAGRWMVVTMDESVRGTGGMTRHVGSSFSPPWPSRAFALPWHPDG